MKKKENQIDSLPLNPDWDGNDLIEWFQQNRRYLIWGIVAILACLFATYYFYAKDKQQERHDYVTASRDVAKLNLPSKESQSLTQLQEILKRRPQLQAKYDGEIAQSLLNVGDVKIADPFAERTLKRISDDNIPLYIDYAKNSLMVEKGQFAQALSQAQALKLTMLKGYNPQAFGPMLYLFNLIRIGMLQKQLGQVDEENKTWQELKKLSQGDSRLGVSSQDWNQVFQHLEQRGITLREFIDKNST